MGADSIDSSQTIRVNGDSQNLQAHCPARYKIEELIGQGGMGMVLRAVDTELQRNVAIKLLIFEGSREQGVQERFLREAKTLAILDHPNIVRIYSSGINEQGNPYHVMEYLEGDSLAKELQSGPLSAARFYEVFSQVLEGLKHAHNAKVVHRDLKPSNIMHCKDGDGAGVYKIIDFGIARLDLDESAAGKSLTRSNAVLGSPLYISPEQCRGERGDYSSDIYSLGCIMYECITGAPPFLGETAFETMYKHLTEASIKLDARAVSLSSKKLASLIDRCLEKKAEGRPQSVDEMLDELKSCFREGNERFDLFSARQAQKRKSAPVLQICGLLALVLLILASGCWMFYFRPAARSSTEVFVKTDEQVLANDIRRARERVDKFGELDKIVDASQLTRAQHDLFTLGRLQLKSTNTQMNADAEKTFDDALMICNKDGKQLAEYLPACYVLKAKSEWKQGNYRASTDDFQKAIDLVKEQNRDITVLHDILMERSLLRIHERRFADAFRDYMVVVKYYEEHDRGKPNFLASLEKFDSFDQQLDRLGDNRLIMTTNIAVELRKMSPQSEAEASDMMLLAHRLVESLFRINRKDDAAILLRFAQTKILPKIENKAKFEEAVRSMEDFFKAHPGHDPFNAYK